MKEHKFSQIYPPLFFMQPLLNIYKTHQSALIAGCLVTTWSARGDSVSRSHTKCDMIITHQVLDVIAYQVHHPAARWLLSVVR